MKNLLTLIFLTVVCFGAAAQPGLVFQKTYGGAGHEYIHQTIPTADGGFAFVGYSESSDGDLPANKGGEDLWVAKANAAGTLEWSYNFGGTADEEGMDLLQTADGGFFVAGWTDSFDGDVTAHQGSSQNADFWILHLDANGSLLDAQCFGGTSDDEAVAIEFTADGKLLAAGTTYSYDGDVSGNHGSYETDLWVIRIDTSLALLAQKCVGGTDSEEAFDMILTNDGGCAITGRSYSADGDVTGYHAGSDMIVAKLSSAFVVEWARCYGGSETEEGNAIVQNVDLTYTVLGYTSTHNNGDVTGHHGTQGMDDYWLLKLSADGSITWAKCYGGSGDDQANGLTKAASGGWAMSGLTSSADGDVSGFHNGGFFSPDYWVAVVDDAGTLQWQRCCGGSDQDESFHIYEESPNVFVVTGFTYSPDGDVSNWKGDADGWICKVTGTSGISSALSSGAQSFFPNPANDRLNFNERIDALRIYRVDGTLVFESLEPAQSFTLPALARGVYMIEYRLQGSAVRELLEILAY